jgi:hypothetical protein
MGGPTLGTRRIGNMSIERCSPSLVWSDDSNFLAVPQRTSKLMQRLLILKMTMTPQRHCYAPGEYHVLELHDFEGGVIRGIDSPIHRPVRFEIRLSDFGDRHFIDRSTSDIPQ